MSDPNSNQFRMIGLVAGSGAIGGLIAWVLQAATGARLLPLPWYGSVPTALLLGGAAAGIGVYVLANTDLQQVGRAIFFALLCGISFKPVFQAGSDFVGGTISQAKAQSRLSEVQQDTQKLDQAVATQPSPQVSAAAQKAAETTASLVHSSASVPDEALKTELQARSQKAVDTIVAATLKAPNTSLKGLYDVGIAAKQTNQANVTLHVIDSLHKIEASIPDQATKNLAREYASKIERSN